MRFTRTLPVLLLASPALAEGGMPQMDPTWFGNQLTWLAISFALLYLVVSRLIVPGVGGVLSTRANAINDAIAEAERAKLAASQTRGDFEAAGNSARTQAAELLAKAQAKASADATEATTKLSNDINRKSEQAEVRINDALKKASAGIDNAVEELAKAMVDKLLAKGA